MRLQPMQVLRASEHEEWQGDGNEEHRRANRIVGQACTSETHTVRLRRLLGGPSYTSHGRENVA